MPEAKPLVTSPTDQQQVQPAGEHHPVILPEEAKDLGVAPVHAPVSVEPVVAAVGIKAVMSDQIGVPVAHDPVSAAQSPDGMIAQLLQKTKGPVQEAGTWAALTELKKRNDAAKRKV